MINNDFVPCLSYLDIELQWANNLWLVALNVFRLIYILQVNEKLAIEMALKMKII